MSGTLAKTLVDVAGAQIAGDASLHTAAAARKAGSLALARCYHCGEPCLETAYSRPDKAFCCRGCMTVHDLLAESGLDQFYELESHPGIRMRPAPEAGRWAFLDEPAVRQKLIDFTDGQQSRVTFHIPAVHCVACVWLLENLFRLHPGIGRTEVNFPRREVAIWFSVQGIKLSDVVALLDSIGYPPALSFGELGKAQPHSAHKRRWLQVGIAGFAFGNIMLLSVPQYFGLDSFSAQFKPLFGWLSLALAFPVVVFSASDYWKAALLSLRQRIVTLDVPISLGLLAIYGQSVYQILSRTGEGYCDSLTGLIFFLLCGRAFQQRAQDRLAFDRDFKSFFPLSVLRRKWTDSTRTGMDGDERISLAQLEAGDRVTIRNGEIIPADSVLAKGAALIDYSFVTGESVPVARHEGEYLYAGGRQIGEAIELDTVKSVSQSYLTSLWNHETFRKDRNESLNTSTNRYSRRFTVLVVGIAVLAAILWVVTGDPSRGLKAFVSVLIVACPCALALAAPFTLGTAQRWLARLNVFVKNALVLERMARVDTIVFDKTGTLTGGGASAVRWIGSPLEATEEARILSLVRHSTHPHSARIGELLQANGVAEPMQAFKETPGAGIEGTVQNVSMRIGSGAWLASHGTSVADVGLDAGGSLVHVAFAGVYRGAFVLSSALRPDSDQLIRRLAGKYELALLSGDNEREREEFRLLFGDHARLNFNQSPLDKLGFIERLQASGRNVMMIGDGLNDAGALRQSDVGVAVIENAGAFSPASDVILEGNRVPQLMDMLAFSRRAARIVRVSLGISAVYNLVGVSIAAAGLLSPLVCAVLMPLSSVSVVVFACGMTTWAARRMGLSGNAGGSKTAASPASGRRVAA